MIENKEDIFQEQLNDLVCFLKNQEIKFVLLGEPTGKTILSSDLDLCAEDIEKFDIAIKKFCNKESRALLTKRYHATGIRYDFSFFHKNKQFVFPGPDLLIFPTWHIKGDVGLSYTNMLNNSTRIDKEYHKPSNDDAFLFYFIKRVDKGDLAKKQEVYLKELFLQDPVGIEKRLNTFFSVKNVELISTAAATGCWDPVRAQIPQLTAELVARERVSFSRWVWFSKRLARRFFAPTGLFVVILGPDGSGKSSVIDEVISAATPPFTNTNYTHLRPGLGLKKGQNFIVTSPHNEPPRGLIASIIKIIYFLFDYRLGYFLKIKPLLIKSTLVVFDRYYYDLLIDPKRYRYGGPMWLARLIGKLIPKPDIVILLDAPPEVLQARKQEVSFKETARQRDAYLQYVQGLQNGVVIDASQALKQVGYDTNETIYKIMSKRATG